MPGQVGGHGLPAAADHARGSVLPVDAVVPHEGPAADPVADIEGRDELPDRLLRTHRPSVSSPAVSDPGSAHPSFRRPGGVTSGVALAAVAGFPPMSLSSRGRRRWGPPGRTSPVARRRGSPATASAPATPRRNGLAGRAPVASAKTTSPSSGEWPGTRPGRRRRGPSARRAARLGRREPPSVTTQTSVVLPGAASARDARAGSRTAPRRRARSRRSRAQAPASTSPSSSMHVAEGVHDRERGHAWPRRAAAGWPRRARPCTAPSRPRSLPTVAPVPAPTLPSACGSSRAPPRRRPSPSAGPGRRRLARHARS